MFQEIYEIRLAGKDIEIDNEKWDDIREHARGNKWFFVIYKDAKYRYVKAQTFEFRPTRFDFELAAPEDEEVDFIYVIEK